MPETMIDKMEQKASKRGMGKRGREQEEMTERERREAENKPPRRAQMILKRMVKKKLCKKIDPPAASKRETQSQGEEGGRASRPREGKTKKRVNRHALPLGGVF